MLRPTDRIMGPGRGNAAQFITWARNQGAIGPYEDWTYAVQTVCNAIGMDRAIIWFQAAWECQFQSSYWEDGNSGGMGIDADGWPTPFDINPNKGEDSALVHVATMWAMLGNVVYPAILRPAREYLATEWLEHVEHMVTDPNRPPVAYLGDLNKRFRSVITGDMEATWAWDAHYVTGICARANATRLWLPDQETLTPVIKFAGSRMFHTVEGAVFREGPFVAAKELRRPNAGTRVRCAGWRAGQFVAGSDQWLVASGAHGWHVHRSGVKESIL